MTIEWSVHPSARVADDVVVRGHGRITVAEFATVEEHVLIDLGGAGSGRIELRPRSKVKFGTALRCYNGSIELGLHSTVGDHSVLYGHGGILIGSHCGIGPHCVVTSSGHITSGLDVPIRYQGEVVAPVTVEDDVWMGAGVRVLAGVTVRTGGIIAAGSVVTTSTPAHFMCAGVPCRPKRRRRPDLEVP